MICCDMDRFVLNDDLSVRIVNPTLDADDAERCRILMTVVDCQYTEIMGSPTKIRIEQSMFTSDGDHQFEFTPGAQPGILPNACLTFRVFTFEEAMERAKRELIYTYGAYKHISVEHLTAWTKEFRRLQSSDMTVIERKFSQVANKVRAYVETENWIKLAMMIGDDVREEMVDNWLTNEGFGEVLGKEMVQDAGALDDGVPAGMYHVFHVITS
jgi:hypothetical protein